MFRVPFCVPRRTLEREALRRWPYMQPWLLRVAGGNPCYVIVFLDPCVAIGYGELHVPAFATPEGLFIGDYCTIAGPGYSSSPTTIEQRFAEWERGEVVFQVPT